MTEKTLRIRYVGDSTGVTKTLGKIDQQNASFASKMKTVGGKVATAFKTMALPAALFGITAVKAFADSEKADLQLQNALKNNPRLAGTSAKSFEELATAIEHKTAADDEAIVSGQAVLANFVKNGKQLADLTPLMVDYARKTGQDIPTAAKSVGKAFLGNVRALKDLGISYKSTGDKTKDMANITDLIRQKVGGFAEQELTTTGGKLENLKNRFGDLQEVVGGQLVGAFDFLTTHMALALPVIAAMTGAWIAYKIATVAAAIAGEAAGLAGVVALGPIAPILIVVTAAVAALAVVIYKNRKPIGDALKAVGGFFADMGNAIIGVVGDLLGWLFDHWAMWLSWFEQVAGAVLAAADFAFGWVPFIGDKIKAARAAFNENMDKIVASLRKSADEFHSWGETTVGQLDAATEAAKRLERQMAAIRPPTGMGNFTHFQHGGKFSGAGIVGEAGPELLIAPWLKGSQIIPNNRLGGGGGGGVAVVVNVNGYVGDSDQLAHVIQVALKRLGRRNVTLELP
jgi:hypothetical protein